VKILDVLTSPWGIPPAKLNEIIAVYRAHLRGPKIDWKAMEAQVLSFKVGLPEKLYEIRDGVAIIPVQGVLTKGMSFFSFLFGGSSMRAIGEAVKKAADDPEALSILLDIDSPGGTVDGTQELANIVYAVRERKECIAFTDGSMTSASYWIGSAARKVFISGDTVDVGSIGVVATHIDQSKWDDMMGDSYTEIVAGKFKRIASAHRPLSKEGAACIQDQVDHIYSAFIADIMRNRGVSEEGALSMADGKVFIGKQALEAGLVDGVSTFDGLIDSLSAGDAGNLTAKEETIVNIQELKEKYPDLYADVILEGKNAGIAEAKVSGEEAVEEARASGATIERQRIADVRAQLIPGHEAIIDALAMDGKTTGPEAAVKVLAAEKVVREGRLAALKADGNLNVNNASGPNFVATADGESAKTMTEAGEKLDKFAKEIKATDKCSYSEALDKAKAAHPGLAKVYDGKED